MIVSKPTKLIIIGEFLAFVLVSGSLFILGDKVQNNLSALNTAKKSDEPVVVIQPPPPTALKPVTKIPDLDRPIVVTANLSESIKENSLKHIKALIEDLKKNPDLYSSWLELGIYRKIIGDYEGAIHAWQYASLLRPNNAVAYGNLANIYIFELSNYKKGEQYLLKAISLAPNQVIYYEQAYEFYRFIVKDTDKARRILEDGVSANPGNTIGLEKLLQEL